MSILYFECASGVAGDMLLASFIHMGTPIDALNTALTSLNLKDVCLDIQNDLRGGVEGNLIKVIHPPQKTHRHLPDIYKIIDESGLNDRVKAHAKDVFTNIGTAEAKVHGVSLEEVHFHEVGAIDSIVDVILNCWCFEYWKEHKNITKFLTSPVNLGGGFVWTEHGRLPVPAPAVGLLAGELDVYGQADVGELATPTGIALLDYYCESIDSFPAGKIQTGGIGLGHKKLPHANILRLFNVEENSKKRHGLMSDKTVHEVVEIETNIDDCSSEILAYAVKTLFKAGALDVFFAPIYMKKGRPAYKLTVLAAPQDREALVQIIFKETSAFGMRYCLKKRDILERQFHKIVFQGYPIQIKTGRMNGEIITIAPEYDDCALAAQELGISLQSVYQACMDASRS